MTKPTIHLNGSDRVTLHKGYKAAQVALRAAAAALAETAPNGRDYYLAPGSLEAAQREHESRMARIQDVLEEVAGLAIHCYPKGML